VQRFSEETRPRVKKCPATKPELTLETEVLERCGGTQAAAACPPTRHRDGGLVSSEQKLASTAIPYRLSALRYVPVM